MKVAVTIYLSFYFSLTVFCPAGQENLPIDSRECQPCPTGSYRDGSQAEKFQTCSQCPSGNTTNGEGKTTLADCSRSMNCPLQEGKNFNLLYFLNCNLNSFDTFRCSFQMLLTKS